MSESEHRDIEDLVRHALQEEAARIQPMGDGLERIRGRVFRRRRALSWLRPAVAVASATAVVAAAATLPVYLHRGGEAAQRDNLALSASPSTATPRDETVRVATPPWPGASTTTTAGEPPRTSPGEPLIDGDPSLPDMTTVWPYSSRAEGRRRADRDVADRTHPVLRDPQETALEFVQSFVGTDDPLVAESGVSLNAGIGVTISRKADGGTLRPVSVVYLVRVRKADDSPYVVVNAEEPVRPQGESAMTVEPGQLNGTAEVTVDGSLVQPPAQQKVASVKVELREPGGDETLAFMSPTLTAQPNHDERTWTAHLTPMRRLSTPTGTVAAWTVDVENHLLGFVAVPTS